MAAEQPRALAVQTVSSSSPESFLFYVVAPVGPSDGHRPLAVALRTGVRGADLIAACAQVLEVLAAPANRPAIEAELLLASSFYRDHRVDSVPLREPAVPAPGMLGLLDAEGEDTVAATPPWDAGLKKFPFLSTCLLLGLGYDAYHCAAYDVRLLPLGTAYRDDSAKYGMAVFDLADLHTIRYGIVCFQIHFVAEVPLNHYGGWDPVEDDTPATEPTPVLEEDRPRRALSAGDYRKKLHWAADEELRAVLHKLDGQPLVQPQSMDFIWPVGEDHAAAPSAAPAAPTRTLGRQAMMSLIDSTFDVASFDMGVFDEPLKRPWFRDSLREHLVPNGHRLGPTQAAGQLLRLAYAGRTHLNWVLFKHLSYEAVAAALEAAELGNATQLSLCVDSLTGDPAALFHSLGQLQGLRHVNFLQDPARSDDDTCARLYLTMSTDAQHRELLRSKSLCFSCAYSAPLRKALWLPTSDYVPPLAVFPVPHMFVRHQLGLGEGRPRFWPNHFYLGDALLTPARFAAGFLRYLCSLGRDERLFGFAHAPPAASAPMGPLAAETLTVPRHPLEAPGGRGAAVDRECWPRTRDLAPGAWVVLVSYERHQDRAAEKLRRRRRQVYPTATTVVRYAFAHVRRRIAVGPDSVAPGDVEISGLLEFLQATAPDADIAAAKAQLQRVAEALDLRTSAEGFPVALAPGMERLSVLPEGDARAMLRDFLADAIFIRGNLRQAMIEDPARNWYPELIEREGSPSERDTRVFQSISTYEAPVVKGLAQS